MKILFVDLRPMPEGARQLTTQQFQVGPNCPTTSQQLPCNFLATSQQLPSMGAGGCPEAHHARFRWALP
jgi:hypothetical protein